jgi:hypothetical protein
MTGNDMHYQLNKNDAVYTNGYVSKDDQSKTDQTQYNIVLLPLIFALLWIKYIAKLKLDLKRPDRIFHQYNFC